MQIRMGVPVRIVVYAPDENTSKVATDAAYDRLRQLDRCLSDYDPESELNRLCQHAAGEPVKVSDDLWKMLAESQRYSTVSDGAFDVTIGSVVKLWRVARRRKAFPDANQLEEAKRHVGYKLVSLDCSKQTATLKLQNMQLDFGGIAKGYGSEEAYQILAKHGLTRSLVAVAGEVRAGDPPPDSSGWRVEIEDRARTSTDTRPLLILSLKNRAVSTSADLYQFVELNGIRYSHIVDPRTGIGVTTPMSVTIVSDDCTQTDALATVVSVLGPEKGMHLLRTAFPDVQALIVTLDHQKKPISIQTDGWKSLVSEGVKTPGE
ncbi:FAD:protein FMN transferase [Planctomicrobium sp. SH527]|uniref:FAD:protein FMN transferase n=1 Tax=Planctomicrobium sp. SH527 TaxID=3448123 RepID=UPI003F5C12C6